MAYSLPNFWMQSPILNDQSYAYVECKWKISVNETGEAKIIKEVSIPMNKPLGTIEGLFLVQSPLVCHLILF
jgi:hypothetical protein